jgi:D-alanyl-D-alanine carboxypeptidase
MERRKDFNSIVLTTVLPLIAIGGMLFFIAYKENHKKHETTAVVTPSPTMVKPEKPFPEVVLQAKAAIVYDAEDKKVLFEKNADKALPLASLTKLMTALVAADNAPAYTLVTINKDDLRAEGDSGLRANEIWKLQDLLDFTLTVSSNDGARAVASVIGATTHTGSTTLENRLAFLTLMNAAAKKLGLSSTRFENETGLDIDATTAGAVGSARDVAKLLTHILTARPELLTATRKEKIEVQSGSLITHNASNTNEALSKIPSVIGSKTGYTDLAGGNLAVALTVPVGEHQHPIIIVALGSTLEGRFSDIELLATSTLRHLSNR